MKKIFIVCAALLPLFFASCASNKTLYNFGAYSSETYKYVKGGDEDNTEALLEVYQKVIDGQDGTIRETVPPGVCADYGYLLVRAGKVEEGKVLLLKEKELYPESARFIDSIIKRIER